jgi:hypothetical protein
LGAVAAWTRATLHGSHVDPVREEVRDAYYPIVTKPV